MNIFARHCLLYLPNDHYFCYYIDSYWIKALLANFSQMSSKLFWERSQNLIPIIKKLTKKSTHVHFLKEFFQIFPLRCLSVTTQTQPRSRRWWKISLMLCVHASCCLLIGTASSKEKDSSWWTSCSGKASPWKKPSPFGSTSARNWAVSWAILHFHVCTVTAYLPVSSCVCTAPIRDVLTERFFLETDVSHYFTDLFVALNTTWQVVKFSCIEIKSRLGKSVTN